MATEKDCLRASEPPGKSQQANPLRLLLIVGAGVLVIIGGALGQTFLFARGSDEQSEQKPIVTGSIQPYVVRDAPSYATLTAREVAPPANPSVNAPDPDAEARRLAAEARRLEEAALASPLVFGRDDARQSAGRPARSDPQAQLAALEDRLRSLADKDQRGGNGSQTGAGTPAQPAKLDQGKAYAGVVLDKPYLPPASDDLIQAGTLIPAALITGVNSDLPGEIIAQVTEPIHDSRSGNRLLIPAGAKLLGRYDSLIGFGQDRAYMIWDRLLMPNGYSIELDALSGTDKQGQAGAADRVDFHYRRLAFGVLLSSLVSAGAELARGDRDQRDLGREFTDGFATGTNRVAQSLVERFLDVQPTITIRPGWTVRVLVNRDVNLAPYDELRR